MENLVEVVKKHPLPIIGAGALLVLLLMRGSSGSGANAAYSASLSAQSMANNTDIQLATINANASNVRAGYAADTYKAGVAAQVAGQQIDAGVFTSFLNHLDNQTQYSDALQVQTDKTQAGAALAAKALDTQLQVNANDNNAKLSALAQSIGFAKYQTDATTASLPSILHSQETVAQIQASNAQQLAVINGQNTQAIASINTAASRTQANASANTSNVNTLGSLIDIASSFFGF